jgi:Rieske Fe-S protein
LDSSPFNGNGPQAHEAAPASARRALLAVIVGIVTLATAPAVALALAPVFTGHVSKTTDLGPLADFPIGQFEAATYLADPADRSVSQTTAYVRFNGRRGGQPSFTILSSRDSFIGCPVEPNGPSSLLLQYKDVRLLAITPSGFGSNCHDRMQYNNEGNRIHGPVDQALARYAFSIRDGHLFIGASFHVARVEGTGAEAAIYRG